MSKKKSKSNTPLSQKKEQLEIEILKWQVSKKSRKIELIKALASTAGMFAAVIAILSLGFSIFQYNENLSDNRKNRIEERLDNALNRIGNENSLQRLGGIVSLRSFLNSNDADRNSQVILSLTNSLALENDPIVRTSIIETLKAISVNDNTLESLNEALVSLVELNRIAVERGSLRTNRINLDSVVYYHKNNLNPTSYESHAIDISKGILVLLRKGILLNDLSEIYCIGCDFSNLNLNGVKFDYSILDGSNFSNCHLNNASFKWADIEEVSFKYAELRNADFSFDYEEQIKHTVKSYVKRRIEWSLHVFEKYFTFDGPDFSYANLSNAKFSNHPLIYMSSSDTKSYNRYAVDPASFIGSILDSTDFMNINSYGITGTNVYVPFYGRNFKWPEQSQSIMADGRNINILRISDHVNQIKETKVGEFDVFRNNLDFLISKFDGSNWEDAKLPKSLRYFLEKGRTK